MDANTYRKACRRTWLLALVGAVYTVLYAGLAVKTNFPETEPTWDADGVPFVPASSIYADGYPVPAAVPAAGSAPEPAIDAEGEDQ